MNDKFTDPTDYGLPLTRRETLCVYAIFSVALAILLALFCVLLFTNI